MTREMTQVPLPYIHRFVDRHGTVRHYFRRAGFPQSRLPGAPGSPEFLAAYQTALTCRQSPIGLGRESKGSVSSLIASYYQSAEWKQLAQVTQATYRNILERFREDHGDKPVGRLEREHVRRLVAAKAEKPSAANSLLKMLRILMRFATQEGWRKDDPTHGVRRIKTPTEGWHSWTEQEIALFEAYYPIGSRPRLALALLLYTGQRRGDVLRMGRQHLRDGYIDVRQQKTGERLRIPIVPGACRGARSCSSGSAHILDNEGWHPVFTRRFHELFS
jgi:integrase